MFNECLGPGEAKMIKKELLFYRRSQAQEKETDKEMNNHNKRHEHSSMGKWEE